MSRPSHALRAVSIMLSCLAAFAAGCPTPASDPDADPNAASDPNTPDPNTPGEPNVPGPDGLTAAQRLRADQIVSVFENDTIEIQYAFIANINDGRGYTAGRAGFTSATHDMYVVIEKYTQEVPDNDLAQYLPRIQELSDAGSDSTDGLEGLPEAWVAAADDPRFRAAQDAVVDQEYYLPAVQQWKDLGLTKALSLAALYDANIQHGAGDDPDGVPAMIDRATEQAGGTPKTGVTEAEWLAAFLDVRHATLAHAFNPDTREAWAESTYRPDLFAELADLNNWNLTGPIQIENVDHSATIP